MKAKDGCVRIMFQKQTKIYTRRRSNSFLVTTVAILVISAVAALAGTLYWDKLQNGEDAQGVTAQLDPQVPKQSDQPQASSGGRHQQVIETAEESEDTPSEETPAETGEEQTEPEGQLPTTTSPPGQVPEGPAVTDSYFDDAAFVGDSITEGVALYEVMSNATIIAAKGINPDTVFKEDQIRTKDGYVSVLQALEQADPAKIYILFGANGVGWFTPEHFEESYGKFVDEVKAQHPDSIIYLQSITPVTKDYTGSADQEINNDKINEYNKIIAKIAEEKGVYYLDIASALKGEDGCLPDEASNDGMHFTPEYYLKWFAYLKTHTVQ